MRQRGGNECTRGKGRKGGARGEVSFGRHRRTGDGRGQSTHETTRASAGAGKEDVSLVGDRESDKGATDEATVRDLRQAGALGVGEFLRAQVVSDVAEKIKRRVAPL